MRRPMLSLGTSFLLALSVVVVGEDLNGYTHIGCFGVDDLTLADYRDNIPPQDVTLGWCNGVCNLQVNVSDIFGLWRGDFGDGTQVRCYCGGRSLHQVLDSSCQKRCGWNMLACGGNALDGAFETNFISNYRDTNECLNLNGGCAHVCHNTAGSYVCQCHQGYHLKTYHLCADIDECSAGVDDCSHKCTNTIGSYYCDCKPGYKLVDGHKCSDINECLEDNHPCEHHCQNAAGGYICYCEDGYALAADGKTCIIDLCRFSMLRTDENLFSTCALKSTARELTLRECIYSACADGANLINFQPSEPTLCEARKCQGGNLGLRAAEGPRWDMYGALDDEPRMVTPGPPVWVWVIVASLVSIIVALTLDRIRRCRLGAS